MVYVLQSEFKHNVDSAVQIMLTIHNTSKGIAGIYPKDIAETKVFTVLKMAKHDQHPLKCIMEPE